MADAPDVATVEPSLAIPLEFLPDIISVSADGSVPWTHVGGFEEDDGLELHLVVAHPTEAKLSARLTLFVPIERHEDGHDVRLVVGTPKLRQ